MIKLFRASLLSALLLVKASYGEETYVNWYLCETVEYRVDYVKDEQRKINTAKRADRLNSRMRKLKKQLATCKAQGYLK